MGCKHCGSPFVGSERLMIMHLPRECSLNIGNDIVKILNLTVGRS